MTTIKNILVPTDFSVTSRNAFHYAEHVAEKFNATITVVHVTEFFMPLAQGFEPPMLVSEDSYIHKTMHDFVNDTYEPSKTIEKKKIKIKIIEGNVTHSIIELTESGEFDFVVMGSTGFQDWIAQMTGSTSTHVSQNAKCPVLLVPRDAQWQPIKNILFASNVVSASKQIIPVVKNISDNLNAELHFIYVDEGKHEAEIVNDAVWKSLYSQSEPQYHFHIQTINSTNAVKALNDYATKNNIDWSVFVSSNRTFWQTLTQRSITEAFSLASEKPTLVMHLKV